jgi:MerR family transcriptional regulator, thiopeptide resistance regulator
VEEEIMQTTDGAQLRRIKEFARDAGVTERTLRLYDRLGLLKPAALTESGYRLYGELELERLEQIVALRFVGFTLDQIKELLEKSHQPLAVALRMQRTVIARQKRRLESALEAIDQAERALQGDGSTDLWSTLRTVMEAFRMQNDWEWTQKYYSDEALEKVEERRRSTPQTVVEQGQRDWAALIADVEAAVARGVDPRSEEAKALAERWHALVRQFTDGDAEIQRGLNRLWSDLTHWPTDFKRPWSDAADSFIKAAMNCEDALRSSHEM